MICKFPVNLNALLFLVKVFIYHNLLGSCEALKIKYFMWMHTWFEKDHVKIHLRQIEYLNGESPKRRQMWQVFFSHDCSTIILMIIYSPLLILGSYVCVDPAHLHNYTEEETCWMFFFHLIVQVLTITVTCTKSLYINTSIHFSYIKFYSESW